MKEDFEIIEDDCNCEDTPLIVYCKKCKRVYLCTSKEERTEISHMGALPKFLHKELSDEEEGEEDGC
jgi:hypothetical protein